jgi:hypothetical protein
MEPNKIIALEEIMKGHEFNFDGGEYLSKIGASWFVSYSYYVFVDGNHLNWCNIKTVAYRTRIYDTTKIYHKFWLTQVENMNNNFLNKNQIGVDASITKKMAKELLEI